MGGSTKGPVQLNNLYPGPILDTDAGFPYLRPPIAHGRGATNSAAVWPQLLYARAAAVLESDSGFPVISRSANTVGHDGTMKDDLPNLVDVGHPYECIFDVQSTNLRYGRDLTHAAALYDT